MLERKGHSFALDWYMLGVVVYELLDGYPPYYDKDREKLFHNIKNAKLNLPANISESCADFIKAVYHSCMLSYCKKIHKSDLDQRQMLRRSRNTHFLGTLTGEMFMRGKYIYHHKKVRVT